MLAGRNPRDGSTAMPRIWGLACDGGHPAPRRPRMGHHPRRPRSGRTCLANSIQDLAGRLASAIRRARVRGGAFRFGAICGFCCCAIGVKAETRMLVEGGPHGQFRRCEGSQKSRPHDVGAAGLMMVVPYTGPAARRTNALRVAASAVRSAPIRCGNHTSGRNLPGFSRNSAMPLIR